MAGATSGTADLSPQRVTQLDEAARAERAQRIAAMLDRWAEEDCSDEPDWDVAQIQPLRIGIPDAVAERPLGRP